MARAAQLRRPNLPPASAPAETMRQAVERELLALSKRIDEVRSALDDIDTSGGGAPEGGPYLTHAISGALTNYRQLLAGTNVTFDDSVASARTINVAAGLSQEQIEDLIGTVVIAGTGITATYNDGAGTHTIATTITQYTDEMARDTIGAALVGGTGITVTPNDGADTITIATTITQYTDEMAQDAVGDAFVGSATITPSYDDTNNEMSWEVADDSITFAKMQNIATDRLVGRDTAGSGNPEEIAVTNGLAFTGSQQIGIANDGVTFARMQNISTDRLLGRDTAGSGDVEEISLGTGLQWSGAGAIEMDQAAVAGRVIYSVDFTTLANNTFVNGTETIDGLNWTCAATSNTSRTIFDIQNGTGLRWTAPTSSATAFDSASQTAAHIYIDLSAFTLWRPEEDLIVEVQYTGTFENGNDGFYFGLWGQANSPVSIGTASVSRMECANRANSGGNQTVRTLHNTTINATNVIDVSAHDCAMARFTNDGTFSTFYGTYSGGFPTAAYNVGVSQLTAQSLVNSMMCQNTRLVLAFRSVSDASPTSAVTIQRLRLRRGI
jgi:hypothetical protein